MDAQTDATLSRTSTNSVGALPKAAKTSATRPDSTPLQSSWLELLSRIDSDELLTTQDLLLISTKIATDGPLTSTEKDKFNDKLAEL